MFLVAGALWLLANLVFRWINWPLFHGHGAYGWPQPGAVELGALLLVSAAPLLALVALLGLALRRRPPGQALVWAWVALLALITVVELDMSWYAMSKSHITWRDVHMFLTEPWEEHFGIRDEDVRRFALLMGVHALALGAAAWVAWRWGERLRAAVSVRALAMGLVVALGGLLAGQAVALQRAETGDRDQWVAVLRANPFVPGWWERLADSDWFRDEALVALEAQLRARAAQARVVPPPVGTPREVDVLLVTVEGWNAGLFDERTMPFTWAFKDRCRYGVRHFATGNSTHYGVLGLLFGDPPVFYRGPETAGVRGSPFVTALAEAGYRTRRVGADLTIHRNLGHYLDNFSEPAIEDPDDWGNLERALALLRRPGGDFIYLHYLKTHFPYRHDPRFTVFTPEVPEDFDYFTPDLMAYREAVVNRYRNTLRELDAWLERLVAQLPEGTVLVLLGDHGEEMFEQGRLGHSSALNEPQTRTPMMFCGPGIEPGRWEAVTSHADVMPTLFSHLGLPQPPGERLGRDLWQEPAGAAAIAFNNHTRPPKRYRVWGARSWLDLRVRPQGLVPWGAGPDVAAVQEEQAVMALAGALVRRFALQSGS